MALVVGPLARGISS